MPNAERMVRIQLEIPLSLVARIDALHRAAPEAVDKATMYLDALDRGVAALESGDIITAVNRAAPDAREPYADRARPDGSDPARVVLRGDRFVADARRADDRRDAPRSIEAGRRADDHQRARRAVIDDVMGRVDGGDTPASIADALNAEGRRTARGNPWTPANVEQLIHRERARRVRDTWREETAGG